MFFTTYFDFSELINLNNEKLLNLFVYTNLKNRIIFVAKS